MIYNNKSDEIRNLRPKMTFCWLTFDFGGSTYQSNNHEYAKTYFEFKII